MAQAGQAENLRAKGDPAPLIRSIGWILLAVLAAFLINNALVVGFDFPYATALFSGGGAMAGVTFGIYIIAIIGAVLFVLRSSDTALRHDALRIHNFNVYLIRACFWVVLLVGVVDATIAVMRVEDLLELFLSEDMVKKMNLARFVGAKVHMPLVVAGFIIAAFTRMLGFLWLALMIVAAELTIVISRFVFSYEQALMGDLVRYWYAALFLFASAYTLFEDGHVRVDVLYAGFKDRTRGFVNAVGTLALGCTTAWVILWISFNGKQSIVNAPVMNFEITQQGGVGMFVKYQMAAFLGIFAATMLIQFVAFFFEAVADYRGESGKRVSAEPAAH
ncbi:MAG: TRAP transporter small permease subunit [Rhodobacteraceae bacterium]|nr:TRAP transporter small permease subunit [Paracoccaceae bacterium]